MKNWKFQNNNKSNQIHTKKNKNFCYIIYSYTNKKKTSQ